MTILSREWHYKTNKILKITKGEVSVATTAPSTSLWYFAPTKLATTASDGEIS
jgi:hypothetical protein